MSNTDPYAAGRIRTVCQYARSDDSQLLITELREKRLYAWYNIRAGGVKVKIDLALFSLFSAAVTLGRDNFLFRQGIRCPVNSNPVEIFKNLTEQQYLIYLIGYLAYKQFVNNAEAWKTRFYGLFQLHS